MHNIHIRPYESADWPRLIAIHDPARREELRLAGLEEAFVPLAEAAAREGLFDYTLRVAEVDGVVAGFAAYSEEELAWLYVDTAQQRRGIGRALIAAVLRENPHRPLEIEVLAGNEPAIGLYAAMGFAHIETASGRMPGNEAFAVTAHIMRKTD